ncbi:mucin-2-like [Dunckerocampus dactyliophorus]|uniref:mucin-2-like n=1 Tax=Dunckerocampus dactyliophorus TaxID=161453 RepID=UPI0024054A96|nr:mucin-2-like [Dunckerocampus dactyliophorus]
MELPLGGPALRHYTQSRPRPHRQKLNYRPSRPQETIIESENEVLELIGRVDEGVEEFFTKKVLPAEMEKKQDEEPLHEESITVDEVVPATSIPCPPPTKTLRRKLGDFFTLRKRRGVKSEPGHEGRPKKASIADLIRPLREAARAEKEKDKDRVKEHDKENEKEKGKEQPSSITGELAVQETLASDAPPLRGEVAPPRRALREGKSQSLILLSGSAAGTANARKKQLEGQHSFEQKLHLMLQRIGVSKAQPEETQNPEREMKKAESEGTIIDSKAEPTPTFTKHRTMSASSDTRHQIRPSMSAHESAGKPPLLPKPVIKPTSGRNTPENELVQIEEGETSTPTNIKSPTAAPSGPATPAVTTNVTSDSTNAPISSSCTVTSDSDLPTVNTDATPTKGTDQDGKPSESKAEPVSTEPSSSSFPTTLTEPSTPVPSTSTCLESITPSFSATSDSTTSVTILENVYDNRSESLAKSTDVSVKPARPESNGTVSVGDEAITVIATAATTIQVADVKPDAATTTSSVTVASDDLISVPPTSPISSKSTKSTCVAQSSTPPTSDTPITSPSTLPPASTNSITTTTSTDCIDSSSSIVPHSPSSKINITDSISTTTSNAGVTTTDAITSPLTTDPLSYKKTSSVITCLLASDDSSLTTPALTHDSPGQDLQANIDERSSPTFKDIDVEQKSKQTEGKVVTDDAEESEPCKEKATQENSDVTKKEVQEASVKAEDIAVATEVVATEPELEKERLNPEETKSVDGK